jgi:hypothetical protein
VLVVAVGDDFDVLDGTGHSEDLGEHVLRDARAQVSDVKVSPPLHFRHPEKTEMSNKNAEQSRE